MGDIKDNPTQQERVLKFVEELQILSDTLGVTVYVPKDEQLTLLDIEEKQLVRIKITHEDE